MKTKKCKMCKKEFLVKYQMQVFCSVDCHNKFQTKRKPIKCKMCGKMFDPYGLRPMKFCSRKCFEIDMREKRKGKGNPAWRNGTRTNGKSYSSKHMRACSKYRKKFLEKNDYLFCEICGVSSAIKYETHHIVFASEKPMHKELHNDRNLILLCIGCHNKMHGSKKTRNDLVEKRNLNKLFECELKR